MMLLVNESTNIYCHSNLFSVHLLFVYSTSQHLRDELLSQIIEIWMKNHLASDSNCKIVNL